MKGNKIWSALFISGALLMTLSNCQVVKPYQRQYLNDSEMKSGQRPSEKGERNAMSYREGASGGGSGKTSGGCGCN